MQPIRPEPWTVGVRLQAEPDTAYQVAIAPGSVVDGRTVEEVADLVGNVWISMVVRDGVLLPARGDTQLRAGDLVTLLIDEDSSHEVAMFTKPGRALDPDWSQDVAEAGDGIGGLGPELCISCGSAGLAARKPERASCYSPDREYHLPFHAVHLSGQ